MPTITVKAKLREARYTDGSLCRQYIQLPKIDRNHCDMSAFRAHSKFGGFANSDLFSGMLRRELSSRGIGEQITLGNGDGPKALPTGVTVTPGFLHTVTIELA